MVLRYAGDGTAILVLVVIPAVGYFHYGIHPILVEHRRRKHFARDTIERNRRSA